MMHRLWPWLAALGSGLLLTLCFPRWYQGWLAWVALTPLISALWFSRFCNPEQPDAAASKGGRWRRLTRRPAFRGALLGYLTGLTFFWLAFSWLTTVTGLGWFILPFYMGLYPALWSAYLVAFKPYAGDFTLSSRNLLLAISGAAAWTALEWIRGWLFSGFGWNSLGVAFHQNLPFAQIAEYTGVGGLTFLATLTNLIIVITVQRFRSEIQLRRIRPHLDFSFTLALIALVFLFGVRSFSKKAPEERIPLRVAAVQPNVPQEEKFHPAFERRIFERLTLLTETALAWEPELLIWPEAATPRGLYADRANYDLVMGFAARENLNFLLGTLDGDPRVQEEYNVAALLTQKGEEVQIYRKIHLVPFGEYIPFRQSFPLFAMIVGDLVPSDFTPGTAAQPLQLHHPALKAAPLICFEDTLGELTRAFVQNGAQLLVNVTNDGWFLRSAASQQHLANAIFRAIENRRPLVRAANTGVTAFIDPLGRVTRTFENPFDEGVLTEIVQVPPAGTGLTFYSRHGEFFSKFCALFAAVMLPWVRRR